MGSWVSFWRGCLVMNESEAFRHWGMRIITWRNEGRWWLHYWTPIWHDGRGPYVSIGLGFFAIYRGY